METLYNWILKVLHVLIPGLFYLADVLFLTLALASTDIVSINMNFKEYQLTIIILILLIAYLVGFSVNSATQLFIWWIKPKYKEYFIKIVNDPEGKSHRYSGYYLSFIMIRHLMISILFLGPILYFYFLKLELNQLGSCLLTTCLLFSIVLFFAYLQLRIQVDQIKKANE
jgi:hypothetical protein